MLALLSPISVGDEVVHEVHVRIPIPHDKAFAGARGGTSLHIDQFIIQGANDPAATAREVERVLKRLARGQSALLSD